MNAAVWIGGIMEERSIKLPKWLKLTGVTIILAACILFSNYMGRLGYYQKAMAELTFADVDIASVPDGVRRGEFDARRLAAEVEVTVRGGRLEAIRLIDHVNERGKAAEAILDAMVREQRLDVDVVTGATNSSRAIRKAVENALTGKK